MSEETPDQEQAPNITHSLIEEDMKDSYLRYSMSVIVSRALPDVRDGLKPVHRRVLFGMHDLGVYPGKSFKKSARIVGDVIGKYHPHGDTAAYDSLVRMAQDFSLRCPLVDGQGNFGSVDGDSPAAMRYTEARMAPYAELMLRDLDKKTVDFVPNYDDSMEEPSVLPAAFPNLLVNGSTGIAVGMATNMAPHNLGEVITATKAYIENPDIEPEALLEHIQGPDFPTGGIICGRSGIRAAFLTGRGRIKVRARTEMEILPNGRERILVSEIPYQVNKAHLLEKTAQLIREKKIEGISDLRDESDRNGMRIVIELKRDAVYDVVLNQLYKYTQLQDTFSINNLALVKRQPTRLTLKDMLRHYVNHRHEIVVRRTQFELDKAEARAHILEGLRIALQNIEEVIRIIRASANTDDAKAALENAFQLSAKQSAAIVEMRLRTLTGLEIDKIEKEYAELMAVITDLKDILARRERRMAIIVEELDTVNDKYADLRRTSIEDDADEIDIEDLIADEPMVISLSNAGYIKRCALDSYRSQGRGGVGVAGASLKDEDLIKKLFIASARSFLLVFTDLGRVHWVKVYRIPEASRQAKGKAIVNLVKLQENETVTAIVPVKNFDDNQPIILATRKGIINKMDLDRFSNVRAAGVNAVTLDEGDSLVNVLLAEDDSNLMLATKKGQAICFPPSAFRTMGRGTRGVRGIRLAEGDIVIGLIQLTEGTKVLVISENGYSKRSENGEYRVTNRGGKGIRNLNVTAKTGEAVAVAAIGEGFDAFITTANGTVIRTNVDDIRIIGRASQGVRAMRLREGDKVVDAAFMSRELMGTTAEEVASEKSGDEVASTEGSSVEVSPAENSEESAED